MNPDNLQPSPPIPVQFTVTVPRTEDLSVRAIYMLSQVMESFGSALDPQTEMAAVVSWFNHRYGKERQQ